VLTAGVRRDAWPPSGKGLMDARAGRRHPVGMSVANESSRPANHRDCGALNPLPAVRSPVVSVDWSLEFLQRAQPLQRWLTRRIGSVADAEDLLQDTFLQAHLIGHRFRGESLRSTWLYGVALNLSRHWWAARTNACGGVSGAVGSFAEIEDATPGPEVGLATQQMLKALDQALSHLPTSQFDAVWLMGVEGLSAEDAAQQLGITPGAARLRLSRARAQLRRLMVAD
jgi:RNA polymerase sigma factor (sigma-70 family)